MQFSVLGPVDVTVSGRSLELGGARSRAVLATLIVHANHVVAVDRLIDDLWPGVPADRAAASLQVRLSGLRKLFRGAGLASRLVTQPPGYVLNVSPAELDSCRFEDLVTAGTDALAAGDADVALRHFDAALGLWRGPAFAGIDAEPVRAEAGRLEELRLAAIETRAEALVDSRRVGELAAELEALTAAHPLRERLWQQRMLALYRAGRQAEALRVYRELHAMLAAELGIEPGPQLRDLHARILRQDPALDRPVAIRPAHAPKTRYALTPDGVHIAYQLLGQGDLDIVFVPGLMSHLDLLWENADTAGFFQRLATLGRVILFDKRDTGLSDRAVGDASLAERMDDVRTVMRAAGSTRAVLFGYSEGAPMSILFAATYPENVIALILGSAAARWFPAPGYPCGQETPAMFDALRAIATDRWGQGASIDWYLPSQSASPHAREMFARFERLAVTPGAFLRVLDMIKDIDVRAVLPQLRVPTLVIQRLGDQITPPCHGRYLAANIAGARYFEQPGDHSLRFAGSGDSDALFTEIADFLRGPSGPPTPARVLATILLARTAPLGAAGRLVKDHSGRLLSATEEGIVATFGTPGQAITCAQALLTDAASGGLRASCGIHTGEVAVQGDDVRGAAADIARRVAAFARPGEVLVSRTVRDLLAGSEFCFSDRGRQRLDDSPDGWRLFAVDRRGPAS
jgi:DNA-binding SARP family transcriptional activator/pimeloyl-ACP methyl ester carboxylesterase